MAKLLILKGLPASGKTTYALELVKKGWKRVNKDSLRDMIDGGQWSRDNEDMIKDTEQSIAMTYLTEGYNVVVDDTNFAHEDFWKTTADCCKSEFEVKFFDTPFMECIERDAKRGDKAVGSKVIYGMYERYLMPKPPEHSPLKKNCYIFDIDGTIALNGGRSFYDYSKVYDDHANKPIVDILKALKDEAKIIIVSGRTDNCILETTAWLEKHNIPCYEIHMRKTGDERKDSIVKKEIYDNFIKEKYNVLAVFDDRNQVVDMWRSLGLTCLQVEYGFF